MVKDVQKKKLAILGSTGSIGTQTLDVCAYHGIEVCALSARQNSALLEEQARKFHVKYCALSDKKSAEDLKISLADTDTQVFGGNGGILEMIEACGANTVINSIIGTDGLLPTLKSIECGKNIALANKETLVTAGELVMKRVKEKGVTLMPVDSEHCAIFQCLMNGKREEVSRLILTASGGPFFGMDSEKLKNVTVEQALSHPTWKMGKKITIDSATLMNKCFEMIEAAYLFSFEPQKIDVVLHRESVVHSLVEYVDGALIAQMSLPDMRMCIQYAITYPKREKGIVRKTNLADIGRLTFYKPDYESFPSLSLAPYALERAGVIPAVLNGANDEAVSLFLDGKISFTDITKLVQNTVYSFENIKNPTLEDILCAQKEAKNRVLRAAGG